MLKPLLCREAAQALAEAERKASEAAAAHAQTLQEMGEEMQARIKVLPFCAMTAIVDKDAVHLCKHACTSNVCIQRVYLTAPLMHLDAIMNTCLESVRSCLECPCLRNVMSREGKVSAVRRA